MSLILFLCFLIMTMINLCSSLITAHVINVCFKMEDFKCVYLMRRLKLKEERSVLYWSNNLILVISIIQFYTI